MLVDNNDSEVDAKFGIPQSMNSSKYERKPMSL